MEQRLRPTVDVVFKAIFGSEENKQAILIPFLQDVLQCRIQDLTYKDPIFKIEDVTDKSPVLDIKVQTDNGDLINIEVQIAKQPEFAKRSLYYWAKMYQSQPIKGSDSGYDRLEKAVTINILNFNLFDTSEQPDKYHTKFEILEVDLRFRLLDDLEMHFIELPKFKQVKDSNLDDWMVFFRQGHELQAEVYREMIPPVREAISRLDRLSQNAEFKAIYEARQKELLDRATATQAAVKVNNVTLIVNYLESQQIDSQGYVEKLEKLRGTESQEFLINLFGKQKPEILRMLEEL